MTFSALKATPGSAISMGLRGIDELQQKLEDLAGDDLDDEMEEVVYEELEEIKEASQEIVPVDTGRLHDSAFVDVRRERGKVQGIVGFDTEYALYVHENPDAFHKPPTRWKFLEEAFAMAQAGMLRRISERVWAFLRRR